MSGSLRQCHIQHTKLNWDGQKRMAVGAKEWEVIKNKYITPQLTQCKSVNIQLWYDIDVAVRE